MSIKSVLMQRDNLTAEEAKDIIAEATLALQDLIAEGGSLDEAEDIIADYFGLEPDYLMELL